FFHSPCFFSLFSFKPPVTSYIFTLSLHDALPIFGLIFTMVYASRVKKNPLLSRVHESDRFFREKQADVEQRPFTFVDWLVLIVLTAVMVWVIWGVIVNAWFIPEIASALFSMGRVSGSDGCDFRLTGMP